MNQASPEFVMLLIVIGIVTVPLAVFGLLILGFCVGRYSDINPPWEDEEDEGLISQRPVDKVKFGGAFYHPQEGWQFSETNLDLPGMEDAMLIVPLNTEPKLSEDIKKRLEGRIE